MAGYRSEECRGRLQDPKLPQIVLAHLDLAQTVGRRRTEMQRIGLHLDANIAALNQVRSPGYEAT
jgi:hypothetical protein